MSVPVDVVSGPDIVAAEICRRMRDRIPTIVTFINPYSFHFLRDARVGAVFAQFDIVLPDGIGVVLALRWCRLVRAVRVSFDQTSLFEPVFSCLDAARARIYVAGAHPGVADSAVYRMAEAYRDVQFVGVRDGYGNPADIVEEVLALDPDFVLCGLGVPRQETLALALRDAGYSGVVCTCGGFLDQYAQGAQYYPAWVDRLELRWVYRMWREPRRLWRRYLLFYPGFFLRAFRSGLSDRLGRDRETHLR